MATVGPLEQDLLLVIKAGPRLPADLRRGILVMVGASRDPGR
jgi:hypothetical protein